MDFGQLVPARRLSPVPRAALRTTRCRWLAAATFDAIAGSSASARFQSDHIDQLNFLAEYDSGSVSGSSSALQLPNTSGAMVTLTGRHDGPYRLHNFTVVAGASNDAQPSGLVIPTLFARHERTLDMGSGIQIPCSY